jgi:hypothetical protein
MRSAIEVVALAGICFLGIKGVAFGSDAEAIRQFFNQTLGNYRGGGTLCDYSGDSGSCTRLTSEARWSGQPDGGWYVYIPMRTSQGTEGVWKDGFLIIGEDLYADSDLERPVAINSVSSGNLAYERKFTDNVGTPPKEYLYSVSFSRFSMGDASELSAVMETRINGRLRKSLSLRMK